MKTIIAGSRTITNYKLIKETLDNINFKITEIVSGTAIGVDKLGEKYGLENNIQIKQFPANWDKYGKSAGYIRNKDMADYADDCIVFYNGISNGSNHMIKISKENNLILKIFIIRRK